jgi:hypothetical protein
VILKIVRIILEKKYTFKYELTLRSQMKLMVRVINLFLLLSILVLPTFLFAQKKKYNSLQPRFDISSNSIFYPHRFQPHNLKMEVALSQVKLPFDWLETAVQVPLLHFHANYALTKSITLDGRISTLYIANQITLGPRWHQQINNFSFNLGYDIAYAFGFLKVEGFDSSVSTWINYPNASIGFKINDIAFTLKGEASIVTSNESRQGDIVVSRDRNFFNGYTIGLYMEQRLWKDHVFIVGVKDSSAKYNFMAWPAFSTFNRFYNIPELYLGLIL